MTNDTKDEKDNAASPRIQMQLSRKRKRTNTSAETTTTTGSSSPLASSSSSSSSSSSDDDDDAFHKKQKKKSWRVKLYRLNTDGSWDDRGTGRIVCQYSSSNNLNTTTTTTTSLQQQLGDPTLILKSEQDDHVLLSSRVLLREAYQRQGDNIITWCEPYDVPEHERHEEKQSPSPPGVSNHSFIYYYIYIYNECFCILTVYTFIFRSTWPCRFKTMPDVWIFGVKLLAFKVEPPNGIPRKNNTILR
jgi:hypothetical protein